MEFFKIKIGYSTGSVAKGDFMKAIDILLENKIACIELSALRENELDSLLLALDELPLHNFSYISFHAPSKLMKLSEVDLIQKLLILKEKNWPIIVRPDIIIDFEEWKVFGNNLCIENMDKRKPIGRNAQELEYIFTQLPEAMLCFDIAHIKQIDPTMLEAIDVLKKYQNRIVQIHLSELNSESKHEPLTLEALASYNSIYRYLPKNVPIIIESPIREEAIMIEYKKAKDLFNKAYSENILSDLIANKFDAAFTEKIYPIY